MPDLASVVKGTLGVQAQEDDTGSYYQSLPRKLVTVIVVQCDGTCSIPVPVPVQVPRTRAVAHLFRVVPHLLLNSLMSLDVRSAEL